MLKYLGGYCVCNLLSNTSVKTKSEGKKANVAKFVNLGGSLCVLKILVIRLNSQGG